MMQCEYVQHDQMIPIPSCDYTMSYHYISKYVKSLRQKKIELGQIQLCKLTQYVEIIIRFIESKRAVDNPLFLEALITLDNTLNIDSSLLRKIKFSKEMFRNINLYFLSVTENDEDQSDVDDIKTQSNCQLKGKCHMKKKSINFELYSVFYLIVMLIYETNRRQDNKQFIKYLLNNQFMNQFLSLQIENGSKIEKLIGIIITYMIKTVNLQQWNKKIKIFLFNNLHLAKDKKIKFYFFYAFKAIKDSILFIQIKKYSLLEFIVSCLENYVATPQSFYIYCLLHTLIKKYPILGYDLLNLNIFAYLEKDLLRQQNQVFNLFELLSQCLPLKIKKQSILVHLGKINSTCQTTKLLSLRMITILLKQVTFQQCIYLVKSNLVDYLLQKLKENPLKNDQKAIMTFLRLFIDKIHSYNENMWSVLVENILACKKNINVSIKNYDFFLNLEQKYNSYVFSIL